MAQYKNNIPQPGDFLSDSQADLLNNFKALDSVYDRNHYKYSTDPGTTVGKHRFVELTNQPTLFSIPPTPPLANLTGTVYTKTTGATGSSNVFYTNDNSGREYQLTNVTSNAASAADFPFLGANIAVTISSADTSTGGWTWLGQGLIMQYGFVTGSPNISSAVITYPVAFTSNAYSIQTTARTSTFADLALGTTNSTTQFGFIVNGAVQSMYWQAIGPYNG